MCASTTIVFEGQQGPSDLAAVDYVTSPLNYFQLFFDNSLMAVLVEQTNIYALQYIAQHELQPQSREHKWVPTTIEELKVYFGLHTVTSLVNKNGSMDSYWTKDTILSTPFLATA